METRNQITIDVTALRTRFEQLQEYLRNTEKRYGKVIAKNAQQICANMMRILEKKNIQLIASLEQLKILYNSNTNKRGLINAIGAKHCRYNGC